MGKCEAESEWEQKRYLHMLIYVSIFKLKIKHMGTFVGWAGENMNKLWGSGWVLSAIGHCKHSTPKNRSWTTYATNIQVSQNDHWYQSPFSLFPHSPFY